MMHLYYRKKEGKKVLRVILFIFIAIALFFVYSIIRPAALMKTLSFLCSHCRKSMMPYRMMWKRSWSEEKTRAMETCCTAQMDM